MTPPATPETTVVFVGNLAICARKTPHLSPGYVQIVFFCTKHPISHFSKTHPNPQHPPYHNLPTRLITHPLHTIPTHPHLITHPLHNPLIQLYYTTSVPPPYPQHPPHCNYPTHPHPITQPLLNPTLLSHKTPPQPPSSQHHPHHNP